MSANDNAHHNVSISLSGHGMIPAEGNIKKTNITRHIKVLHEKSKFGVVRKVKNKDGKWVRVPMKINYHTIISGMD